MRRPVLRFLVTALAVIAILVATLGGIDALICSVTLHVPGRVTDRTPLAYRDVAIRASDGVTLRGWFAPAKQSTGNCVLILHGIGDSRAGSAGFAPLFLQNGYAVLLPDSRAHGASGGQFVTYGFLEKYDALAWVRWARAEGCEKMYALGESLGAAVLIQAAALGSDFRAIVAECAYSDLRSIAAYRMYQITGLPEILGEPVLVETSVIYARLRYGLLLSDVSPLASIRTARTPILLIHGLNDTQTPYWHSQVLHAANSNNALWLVPAAGHTEAYSTAPVEFRKKVLEWFAVNSE